MNSMPCIEESIEGEGNTVLHYLDVLYDDVSKFTHELFTSLRRRRIFSVPFILCIL
jgi:hypothetical protein